MPLDATILHPNAPGRDRTSNLRFRRPALCPIELPVRLRHQLQCAGHGSNVRPARYQRAALPLSYQRVSAARVSLHARARISTPGRIRTGNLRGVSTALLAVELPAYSPRTARVTTCGRAGSVGLRGFEPRTSCMSGRHSGRLSYRPDATNFPDEKAVLVSREGLPAARRGVL